MYKVSSMSDVEKIDNQTLKTWILECAKQTKADQICLVDSSNSWKQELVSILEAKGNFKKVANDFAPNSYWTTSDSTDVARVEDRTFICTNTSDEVGPTNHWKKPEEMKAILDPILNNCMQGRTMYIIPYLMGPAGSPYAHAGVQLTDSPYVTLSMIIMTRVGKEALNLINKTNKFVKGLHTVGNIDPNKRYIAHFPDENSIISVNSNYGGNALLGKKCFALRIASILGKKEGWLAEHMLILAIKNPAGEKFYICAAFPSACGKTNLAMLVPPEEYLKQGWEVTTIGDDIAWLNFGSDGRLYAINPENGFFGVAPGTSTQTNPNMMKTIKFGNCVFTNTAFDPINNKPWWKRLDGAKPEKLITWKNKDYNSADTEPPDHPNSRFTVPARQCPVIDQDWESPQGAPISAIIFGGRRAKAAPLVYETFNWQHGTFVGATMVSETTAAAAGKVGELRRDPMAMKPFLGYHVGDYFKHWLEIGKKAGNKAPKIFHVNWFRTDDAGNFLWPGYGENMRVLEWVINRVGGTVDAKESALGLMPDPKDLNLNGIADKVNLVELLKIVPKEFEADLTSQSEFFKQIGSKLPEELRQESNQLKARLANNSD